MTSYIKIISVLTLFNDINNKPVLLKQNKTVQNVVNTEHYRPTIPKHPSTCRFIVTKTVLNRKTMTGSFILFAHIGFCFEIPQRKLWWMRARSLTRKSPERSHRDWEDLSAAAASSSAYGPPEDFITEPHRRSRRIPGDFFSRRMWI